MEHVLAFVSDGRPPVAANELLALEIVEQLLGLASAYSADRLDGAEPEDLADHRSVLKQVLLLERDRVEPGRDDPLHRLGKPDLGLVTGVEFDHPRELLRVQRISARPLDQRRLQLSGKDCALEQRVHELRCLVGRQRR